jgi:hypothetical protein
MLNFKTSSIMAAAMATVLVTSCGKEKKETIYVTQPQTVNPQTGVPQQQPVQQAPVGQQDQGQAGMQRSITTQVGDLFMVSVEPGQHILYRSSTFDQPGFLKFRMVDASMRDSAAPYPLNCRQSANFEEMIPDLTPAGRPLNYCEITPPLAFNSPSDPIFNSFRWMTMNTMSYNSLAIVSDNSLGASGYYQQSAMGQTPLAKLYINVFTNVSGLPPANQQQAAFTNELSQTVSRLQISCGSQTPQYLGNAAIFQGYFSWSVAVSPIFGCVNPRGGKWYVDVAAFPMDQITPIAPHFGWNSWINQGFANRRAAEIVAEIGPFDYAPVPSQVAPQAQQMMVNQIKRLTP